MIEYRFIIRLKQPENEECFYYPLKTGVTVQADTIYEALAVAVHKGAEQFGQLYNPTTDQLIIEQETAWYD